MSSSSTPMPPLAIIGLGCLFPGSDSPRGFWSAIVNKIDAIRDVPPSHWRAEDYLDPDPKSPDRVYAARGGFLDPVPFEPAAFGIPPSNLDATDASQLLGLLVAQQALADCGYLIGNRSEGKTIDRTRVSVILGVTGTLQLVIPLGARLGHPLWKRALAEAGVDADTAKDVIDRIADGYVGWQENSFPGLLGNVVAGRIANRFDLGGTNCVVDAACASSLSAIHLAAMELATGRADMVLTGGVDTFNDIFMFTCFSKTPALSPTGSARPFDAAADGTVLGEGLGMVVLKRLDDARRDGDTIYAVLKGVGSSSDGKGNAIYAPRREGQIDALKTAYEVAGVTPDTIELVEAHGTGTKVGDATELSALADVYRGSGRGGAWCAVGSIKSQIGHTKAAAGAAGLIKAALALHHKILPPTIKVGEPLGVLRDAGCPLYVNTEKRPWVPSATHPRRAAVSAFGFGGSNFHAVLEEASPSKPGIDWQGDVQILALSAASLPALREMVSAFTPPSSWPDWRGRADRTRREFDVAAPCRLVMVVQRTSDLAAVMKQALKVIDGGSADGVHLGQGAPGKLAVLFPGQGAQYVGMLRDLSCHFPTALDVLSRSGQVEHIYPQPAFTPDERSRQDETLRATDIAQPAIGTVSLGAWRTLEMFGLVADAFAGHSYGELVALCAAGRISEADFFHLSRLRGKLMAAAGPPADRGAMLAVKGDEGTVRQVLNEDGIDLILANKNAPTQTVLSGTSAAIDRAVQAFAKRKVPAVKLAVAAAFHSPLVAAAREPFRAALADAVIHPGKTVFANTTASAYPADADAARDLLAGQLAAPVEWVSQIRALHAAGVRSFVEVGPGNRLTGLVDAILKQDASVIALDASSGKKSGFVDLAMCLAWLAARGHAVDLSLWDPSDPTTSPPRKAAHTVELSGVNYTKPRPPRPARPRVEPPPINGTHPAKMNAPNDRPPPPATPDANALGRALEVTRESLAALQRMQEQAAQLHRQFLDGQDQAHRSVQMLLEQQQRLLQASLGQPVAPVPPMPAPIAPPAPIAARPVAPPVPTPILPQPPTQASIAAKKSQGSGVASAPREGSGVASAPRESESHGALTQPRSEDARATTVLLEVIAEKTGYPTEMLELGMSLDADLGIDSIKRVEILSALQERMPDAPAVKPEHLGTLHTLGDIASFLASGGHPTEVIRVGGTDPLSHVASHHTTDSGGHTPHVASVLERSVPHIVALTQRREAIRLSANAAVWLAGSDALADSLAAKLSASGYRPTIASCADLAHAEPPAELAAVVILAPEQPSDDWLRDTLFVAQRAGPMLRQHKGVLLTVSRLDGAFGLRGESWREPIDGGLAGLAKTVGHEWPAVHARAIDLAADVPAEQGALLLAEEMLLAGPSEVGLSAAGRVTIDRVITPISAGTHTPIQPGEVVVVSGGARGVTAECAVALAQAFRPTLVLLGRSPEPGPADDLETITDAATLKRELSRRHPGTPPRELGALARTIEANREIHRTLARIHAAGAKAIYRSVDVADPDAVAVALADVRRQHGPIRGLIHGAGVLADARIEDKTPAQFDAVFRTKVSGLRSLLAACGDEPKAIVLFSSSTARFGRTGQVDYAIANEVLNKLAWHEATRRPGCQVVALNWGPWDGGMVTPALKDLFTREGVGTIPLDAGARLLVEELRIGPGGPREVVVLAAGSRVEPPAPTLLPPALPTTFERMLTVDDYPVLADHVLDGRPVLPTVLMIEWLAHAAIQQNPGLLFHGLDDLRILQGIVLEGRPVSVRVGAAKATRRDGFFIAPAELRSTRTDGREVLHARAEIVLASTLPAAPAPLPGIVLPAYDRSPAEVYRQGLLFHGPHLHAIERVEGCGPAGIAGQLRAAPPPGQWLTQPLRPQWLTDPLVIDGVFQLAILWTWHQHGAASLPCHLRSYRQWRRSFPNGGCRTVVHVQRSTERMALCDVDLLDAEGKLIARLEGYESVIDPSLEKAYRRRELVRG